MSKKESNDRFRIVTIGEVLKENLSIPEYQRPYRWSAESAITLLNDTYSAYINNVQEYRVGTVVLHCDKEKLKIVDGQQRLTTLSILMYCFFERTKDKKYETLSSLLEEKYNKLSYESIANNYEIMKRKCRDIDDENIDKYIEYLLSKCTIVRIEVNNEQEAFQFFDSQNTRGKALVPHDLLKSYHLREMDEETEIIKVKLINAWENVSQNDFEKLFENHLYPLVRWYKYQDGLYYSVKNIKTFKGVKRNNIFNFSIYHKAANLYIEQINNDGVYELTLGEKLNQFQLTQPLLAGKRFFEYTMYYYEMLNRVEKLIKTVYGNNEIPEYSVGDVYIKNLFVNIIMFYVDKFNFDAMTRERLDIFYKWCYSLRLKMLLVYKETVNKYAQGKRENDGLNMFAVISEMQCPEELDTIILNNIYEKDIPERNQKKYGEICKRIKEERDVNEKRE